MMKRLLLVIRATPYGGIRAREALDAVLLFSAFAPEISVLFSGDGVWQLVGGQCPDGIGMKPVAATLGAFGTYDITRVYADGKALAERGIDGLPLAADARVLDDAGLRELVHSHDRILTF